MVLKIRDRVTIWGVFILLCLLALTLGCGNAAYIVQPSDEPDTTVVPVTKVTGPPHHFVTSPKNMQLTVGVRIALPTMTLYDSADVVIDNPVIGFTYTPTTLDLNLGSWTIQATEAFSSGSLSAAVNWGGQFYRYIPGGYIKLTAEEG